MLSLIRLIKSKYATAALLRAPVHVNDPHLKSLTPSAHLAGNFFDTTFTDHSNDHSCSLLTSIFGHVKALTDHMKLPSIADQDLHTQLVITVVHQSEADIYVVRSDRGLCRHCRKGIES